MPTFSARASRLLVLYFVAALPLLTPAGARAQERMRDQQPDGGIPTFEVPAPPAETSDQKPADPAAGSGATPGGQGAESNPPAAKTKSGDGAGGDGGTKPPAIAGWDDGFFLRSADKQYTLRITGQIQADYRAFLDNEDTKDIDTFLVRRARLGVEAVVFEVFEFRLLPDFGQSQPTIQDAYLNVHYWDAFQVEAGKFKQPFSYEQLIQDRFVPTLERSLIDQLVPARDEGVMVHGQKLFGDRFDYAVSVSNGERDGNADTNDRKDLTGRVVVRPFNDPYYWPVLRYLQVGIDGSTGIEQEPVMPLTLRTPATVPWFQFNAGVKANGLRNRWSPEVSYFFGPLGFAAQYFAMDQDLRPGGRGSAVPDAVRVPFEGFYVLTTLLLTGEERTTYSQAVAPLRPVGPLHPCSCPGAWELVGRVSRLEVGDVVFAPGPARLADPALYSRGATELTLGFNWYLNKWVRVQFNWEHAWFDDPVRFGPGPGGLSQHQDSLLSRLQVIF
jgi:phosphate-selective porin OprO and OprP